MPNVKRRWQISLSLITAGNIWDNERQFITELCLFLDISMWKCAHRMFKYSNFLSLPIYHWKKLRIEGQHLHLHNWHHTSRELEPESVVSHPLSHVHTLTHRHAAWIDYWSVPSLPYSRSMCSGAWLSHLIHNVIHWNCLHMTAYQYQSSAHLMTSQCVSCAALVSEYLVVLMSLQQSCSHHWRATEHRCIMDHPFYRIQWLPSSTVGSSSFFWGWRWKGSMRLGDYWRHQLH